MAQQWAGNPKLFEAVEREWDCFVPQKNQDLNMFKSMACKFVTTEYRTTTAF